MKFPSFYFNWLQKGNPTGTIDLLPELRENGETSVPGVYCVGDLTGIPLIKLAAESGFEIIERLKVNSEFQREREKNTDKDMLDLVICGGGPAGMAVCMHAQELGYRGVVIESSQKFNTIANFPTGKPIYVTPEQPPMKSALNFSDGTKESLLEELHKDVKDKEVPIHEGEMVQHIIQESTGFTVKTTRSTYKALRVIVAIGKSGNARMLGVPGEKLPKVFTRLIDPGEHNDQDVLVVGGGDSALEAANAIAMAGNRVTLSYRKPTFSRPKEHNVERFNELVKTGDITPVMGSKVSEITESDVVLSTGDGEKRIPNAAVYVLIGTEIPIQFFKRSNIRMQGERTAQWWTNLITMVSFFTMLYFGKSGLAFSILDKQEGFLANVLAYLKAPFTVGAHWSLVHYAWYSSLNFYVGWFGSIVFIVSGTLSLVFMLKDTKRFFGSTWNKIKYSYIIFCGVFYTWVYFAVILSRDAGWVEEPTYWYSLLYCTTMLLFGIRRIQKKPTPYIIRQTSLLVVIQVFFLFLLPFYLYDSVIAKTFHPNGYLLREVFPQGKWSSFGLILFWPLNINNFGTSTFWTWFPFVQTFGILWFMVHRWGKGVYCGWICSCGGMAETLGDEYRTLAPHGPVAKKMDNIGQVVLWFAFVATALHYGAQQLTQGGSILADTVWGSYKLSIDVIFAGVLGLGVYFFWGGRVWCRFGCPLAALMHLYTRLSGYRIMANKKRCISCNICTKVCHMGIDVMGYANKGIPMNDVECVRCSACVVNCPMQVLTFGNTGKSDPDNVSYKQSYIPLKRGWEAGLPATDLGMLLAEETKKHPELSTSD